MAIFQSACIIIWWPLISCISGMHIQKYILLHNYKPICCPLISCISGMHIQRYIKHIHIMLMLILCFSVMKIRRISNVHCNYMLTATVCSVSDFYVSNIRHRAEVHRPPGLILAVGVGAWKHWPITVVQTAIHGPVSFTAAQARHV
jgi:hypothetical protein